MKGHPARLGEILDTVLRAVGAGDPLVWKTIESEWAELAGDPWNRLARPVALARRVLIVEVESAAAVSLLRYGSKGLAQRLNQALGGDKIEDIRVRTDPARRSG